jgi:hypothetical protein
MIRFWKVAFTALAMILALAQGASAGSRAISPAPAGSSSVRAVPTQSLVTQRIVIVRPAPLWYDPWWGPVYYAPYPAANYTGNVKIVTHRKGDLIYVDDGFAGVTGKLKKFPLQPGNHTIALRDSDNRTFYHRRVHVIAGKTVEIHVG